MANVSLILWHIEILLGLLLSLLFVLLHYSLCPLHPCEQHRVVPVSLLLLYLPKQ
jgi:hypothetical protein